MKTNKTAQSENASLLEIGQTIQAMPDFERAVVMKFVQALNAQREPKTDAAQQEANQKFNNAIRSAGNLSNQLEPISQALYSRLLDLLSGEQAEELLAIYSTLHMFSILSQFAPRHLAVQEMTGIGMIKLARSEAAKAKKLLQAPAAQKPSQETPGSPHAQN